MLTLRSTTVGFKEWSVICDALGAGRQSLILRKGGIAEGRGGFQWQCRGFFLFPTHFHEQLAQVHWSPSAECAADLAAPGRLVIRWYARVEATAVLTDPAAVSALAPHHVWIDDVVQERFAWGDSPGLSVAFLRVHRLPEPAVLQPDPKFGGCRSWLDLPDIPLDDLVPVLTDEEHARREKELAPFFRN